MTNMILPLVALSVSALSLTMAIKDYRRTKYALNKESEQTIRFTMDQIKQNFKDEDEEQYMVKGIDGVSFTIIFRTDSEDEIYNKLKKLMK